MCRHAKRLFAGKDILEHAEDWDSHDAAARAGIASLSMAYLSSCIVQQKADRSMPEQPEVICTSQLFEVQNATSHAASKLQQRLPQESSPDVLTALVKLAEAVADSIALTLGSNGQGTKLQPSDVHIQQDCEQGPGRAPMAPDAVAACAQQLFEAAEGAASLQEHGALLGQLAWSVCRVAAAVQGPPGQQLPRKMHAAAAGALQKLLVRAVEALLRPPRDVFAGISGAPASASEDMQGAAQRWWHDSAVLLMSAGQLLGVLASFGSLQLPSSRQRRQPAEADVEASEHLAVGGSFWSDVKLAAGSGAIGSSQQTADARATGIKANDNLSIAAKTKEASGEEESDREPTQRPLIEELGTGTARTAKTADPQRNREQASVIGRGGVIIEEISADEIGADDVGEEDLPVLSGTELANVLLACALHSTDQRLNAPWASTDTTAAAASTLEFLAVHLQDPGRRPQKDAKGD